MREILFRGHSLSGKEWVYGVPVPIKIDSHVTDRIEMVKYHGYDQLDYYQLLSEDNEVDPETVGQFTGLLDKNGVKIFEGDIVKCSVIYDVGGYPYFKTEIRDVVYREGCFNPFYDCERNSFEVIGNIHDNPELLEDET